MFKYYGAKYKLRGVYPPPQCDTIIEPFAGSGSFAVHHRNIAKRVILIEKDDRVVALWHRLLGMTAAEIRAIPDPVPGSKSTDLLTFFAAGRATGDTPGGTFVVTSRMSADRAAGGRFRCMIDRVASVVDECRHFEVICGDYTSAPDIEATWFIDPPYQLRSNWKTTRWQRTGGGRYRYPNMSLNYTELAAWVTGRKGQVIACDQEGADWLPFNNKVNARNAVRGGYAEVWYHRELIKGDGTKTGQRE